MHQNGKTIYYQDQITLTLSVNTTPIFQMWYFVSMELSLQKIKFILIYYKTTNPLQSLEETWNNGNKYIYTEEVTHYW